MKVHGVEIPADVEAAAIVRMQRGRFTKVEICGLFYNELPTLPAHLNLNTVSDRAADSLVQRERKAGRIEIADRRRSPVWRWIGGEA